MEENADEIIDRYASMVYRIALGQLGDRYDADDVFQEVFLRYFQKKRKFSSEEHRKAWLIRVTINCCGSFRKNFRLKKGRVILRESCGDFDLPEENFLHSAVFSLPPKYRSVVQLYYFEDLTSEEIGKTLKISSGAVRMRLSRARQLLKQLIEENQKM